MQAEAGFTSTEMVKYMLHRSSQQTAASDQATLGSISASAGQSIVALSNAQSIEAQATVESDLYQCKLH